MSKIHGESEWRMNFQLTDKQVQQVNEWIASLPQQYTGAIGGRFTYEFTPTSIGVAVKVRDAVTKQEIDVSDYEDW